MVLCGGKMKRGVIVKDESDRRIRDVESNACSDQAMSTTRHYSSARPFELDLTQKKTESGSAFPEEATSPNGEVVGAQG